MTNEELNTALYKKVFAEAFVKERNEALFSLDRKKIEAYMIKYQRRIRPRLLLRPRSRYLL